MKARLIIFAAIVLFGCTKPDPPELIVQGTDLQLAGTLDGEAFDMTPGNEDWYLFTDLVVSGPSNYIFQSEVRSLNNDSPEKLTFRFHIKASEGLETSDVLYGMENSEISVAVPNSNDLDYEFATVTGEDVTWSTGGELSTSSNIEIDAEAMAMDGLVVLNANAGCSSSFTSFGLPWGGCQTYFYTGSIGWEIDEDQLILTPPPFTSQFDEVFWLFNGDEYILSGGSELVVEVPNDVEPNEVILGVPGIPDLFSIVIFQLIVITEGSECGMPVIVGAPVENTEGFIEVQYTDEEGRVFSSVIPCDPMGQPNDAFFFVEEVVSYLTNEEGNPTLKVDLNTSLVLRELTEFGTGDSKVLQLEGASIAFAY